MRGWKVVGSVVLCSRPCCSGYVEVTTHPPGLDPLIYCEKVNYTFWSWSSFWNWLMCQKWCYSLDRFNKQSGTLNQHTFDTFVGGKLLGPTFLGSPTVRTVGVGVTFSLLLWKYCWTYRFWLPHSKNCWPVRTVTSNTNSFHLLRDKNCRSNKRCESGSNKWVKSLINTNTFELLGVQNCCITTLFSYKREKGLLNKRGCLLWKNTLEFQKPLAVTDLLVISVMQSDSNSTVCWTMLNVLSCSALCNSALETPTSMLSYTWHTDCYQ